MSNSERIQIYQANPRYWQYKSKPVLLLGGSVEDNLFQIPNLEEHLDLLASVGGNYVRCTMSCRDPGNVWPFAQVGGLYDLDRWNAEFWWRFSTFLQLTAERDIIVQIEVWATFDYYQDNWAVNPFNPLNNRNYTAAESGLPTVVNSHPVRCENNFFWSVPAENNQKTVLKYQQRFVDELLRHALPYGHVLYCIDNETSVTPAWGAYWATYIKERAAEAGVSVETTEMWDAHDLSHPQHRHTLDHPEIYSFCDCSQNNHQRGETHWVNAQRFLAELSPIRPTNNVKIYGSDEPYAKAPPGARDGIQGRYGRTRDGCERFWRNIIGGMASARFHRPPAGIGLNAVAQAHIRSARMLTEAMDIFSCRPHNDLLSNRVGNGAYATANLGCEYAVYFPHGEQVNLDLSAVQGEVRCRWLDIAGSRWAKEETLPGCGVVTLVPPGEGHWAALIQVP